jgi:DNA topoisomerase-2
MPYITYLETLADGIVDKLGKKTPPLIKDFVSLCTEVSVDITVQFPKGVLPTMDDAAIVKLLKLSSTVSTNNMHMFNADCKLHKYQSVQEICDEFYTVRLTAYGKRKRQLLQDMEAKLVKLSNKARYILANLDGRVDLKKKTKAEVDALLNTHDFIRIDGDYKYLIKLPMDSVCQESVDQALKDKAETEKELATLKNTTCEQMWMNELDTFEKEYNKYRETRSIIADTKPKTKKTIKK